MTAPADAPPDHDKENTVHRDNGRTLYSRVDLSRMHNISESTLQNLWVDRANNGHPDAEIIDGIMHWDGAIWWPWYQEFQRQRAAAATTNAPNLSGDPDEEVGPTEAARVCGFADSSTVSGYTKNPPEGWPEPSSYDLLPSGRQRPKWKRWQLWEYVANRKGRGHAGGRIKDRRGLAYPYQGDPRLDLARQALADNPGATNAELIPQLQAQSEKTYSRPTWTLILKSARENPKD